MAANERPHLPPVENSSFMPWLMTTALLHSLAVTERRGIFKNWTVLLAIAAEPLLPKAHEDHDDVIGPPQRIEREEAIHRVADEIPVIGRKTHGCCCE